MAEGGYGGINPGRSAFVCYGYERAGVPEWHRRFMLAHVHADEWVVLTPHMDVYAEMHVADCTQCCLRKNIFAPFIKIRDVYI